MKKASFCLIIALLLCSVTTVLFAEDLFINQGWNFKSAVMEEQTDIPHCWNREDTLLGEGKVYYRGEGVYTKTVSVKFNENKRYFLKFEGANQVTTLFVNNQEVGKHLGGYTAFVFELTDFLKNGKNDFKIVVDNSYNDGILPHVGDFNMYGGIYRPMHWLEKEGVVFERTAYATEGAIVQTSLDEERTEGKLNIQLDVNANPTFANKKLVVKASLVDDEKTVVSETFPLKMTDGVAQLNEELEIENPHLWNGKADPHLYQFHLQLMEKGSKKVLDSVDMEVGFKEVKVDYDKGLFLNGKHLKVHGVCRHQDFEGLGNALTSAHHQKDFELMNEMGVNAIRLAHYPQAQEVYSLADHYGMLVWAEIPFVGGGGYPGSGYSNSPEFHAQAKQQLTEMIQQNSHHAAIFTWGVFNEVKKEGEGPIQLVRELNDLAHQLDETRYTTCATNNNLDFNGVTDLLCWNKYYGWYGGAPSQIGMWADRDHKNGKQPLGISEYGAGASHYQYSNSNKAPIPTGKFHPSNYQAYFHEEHWKAIDKRDYLWGTFVWNMFDFGANHRTEGDRANINDKGLVSFDRTTPKDAFYFYKANWSENPVIHICGGAKTEQKLKRAKIRLYSNLKEVVLKVNGVTVRLNNKGYGIYETKWPQEFMSGDNYIIAEGKNAAGEVVRDSCQWKH